MSYSIYLDFIDFLNFETHNEGVVLALHGDLFFKYAFRITNYIGYRIFN